MRLSDFIVYIAISQLSVFLRNVKEVRRNKLRLVLIDVKDLVLTKRSK